MKEILKICGMMLPGAVNINGNVCFFDAMMKI